MLIVLGIYIVVHVIIGYACIKGYEKQLESKLRRRLIDNSDWNVAKVKDELVKGFTPLAWIPILNLVTCVAVAILLIREKEVNK